MKPTLVYQEQMWLQYTRQLELLMAQQPDIDGRFNLVNLRIGGPYTITVSYVGYSDQSFTDVFLTLGKTENLTLSFNP